MRYILFHFACVALSAVLAFVVGVVSGSALIVSGLPAEAVHGFAVGAGLAVFWIGVVLSGAITLHSMITERMYRHV